MLRVDGPALNVAECCIPSEEEPPPVSDGQPERAGSKVGAKETSVGAAVF